MRTWLVGIRDTKGLTQRNVSEHCGISRSYYADIERGFRNPKVSTAKTIGEYLGFDWTLFFENNGLKTSHKKKHTA